MAGRLVAWMDYPWNYDGGLRSASCNVSAGATKIKKIE
jgi:hypothetical protein